MISIIAFTIGATLGFAAFFSLLWVVYKKHREQSEFN